MVGQAKASWYYQKFRNIGGRVAKEREKQKAIQTDSTFFIWS